MSRKLLFLAAILALSACTPSSTNDTGSSSSSSESTSSAGLSSSDGAFVSMGCKIGGCSSQLCVDSTSEDVISTCEYRPAYGCYKTARCEKQTNGSCGWTETAELTSCLSAAQ